MGTVGYNRRDTSFLVAMIIEISNSRLSGAVLLVTGCCIGAGMLGLPVLSAAAGLKPSLLFFILSWLFMLTTGLLLLEVNLWFKEDASIVTMAKSTLGFKGQCVAWGGFLFLFYALMVAYISGTGQLVKDFTEMTLSLELPSWGCSLAVSLLFGVLIFSGTTVVDYFNRFLMAGLALSYVFLIALGYPHINTDYLKHSDWSKGFLVLPALIISFGFHNLVPSLTAYLKQQRRPLVIALAVGSAIPLFIYLLWEILILGLIPLNGKDGILSALDNGEMATEALKGVIGNTYVSKLAETFAFFAIITSFLGVSLSFLDFLADGLSIKKSVLGKLLLTALVIAPPFLFSLFYPAIFLTALGYAGGIGAVLLFGVLPASMVWVGRYRLNLPGKQIVPGGRLTLTAVIAIALFIMGLQISEQFGS